MHRFMIGCSIGAPFFPQSLPSLERGDASPLNVETLCRPPMSAILPPPPTNVRLCVLSLHRIFGNMNGSSHRTVAHRTYFVSHTHVTASATLLSACHFALAPAMLGMPCHAIAARPCHDAIDSFRCSRAPPPSARYPSGPCQRSAMR